MFSNCDYQVHNRYACSTSLSVRSKSLELSLAKSLKHVINAMWFSNIISSFVGFDYLDLIKQHFSSFCITLCPCGCRWFSNHLPNIREPTLSHLPDLRFFSLCVYVTIASSFANLHSARLYRYVVTLQGLPLSFVVSEESAGQEWVKSITRRVMQILFVLGTLSCVHNATLCQYLSPSQTL